MNRIIKKVTATALSLALLAGTGMISNNFAFGNNTAITVSAASAKSVIINNVIYREYGSYVEVSGCRSTTSSITIPAKINNKPVVSIDSYAFSYSSYLENVTINADIEYIEEGTFKNCRNLKTVTLPDSLEVIWQGAFSGCSNLKTLILPYNTTHVSSSALYGCTRLQNIVVPNKNTFISTAVFKHPTLSTTSEFCGRITCLKGSLAERMAKLRGHRYSSYSLGDVNNDGVVNVMDASAILSAYTALSTGGTITSTQAKLWVTADVDHDGRINASDASCVLSYASKAGTGYTGTFEQFMATR